MSDRWFDAAMAATFGLLGVLALAAVGVIGLMMWFAVSCYQSGDPDSMACYVSSGKTKRVHVDATVK